MPAELFKLWLPLIVFAGVPYWHFTKSISATDRNFGKLAGRFVKRQNTEELLQYYRDVVKDSIKKLKETDPYALLTYETWHRVKSIEDLWDRLVRFIVRKVRRCVLCY